MNTDRLLDRIFGFARRASASALTEVPYGLETMVLAHWREAAGHRSANAGLLRGLRWAALAACAVALCTAALKSDELAAFNQRFDPVTRVADSAIVAGYDYE
jgi:hypothetical protein